jgi:predicted dehydrogenase
MVRPCAAIGVRRRNAPKHRPGKNVVVGFNYRFNPYMTRAKELIQGGAIGQALSLDFVWLFDRRHGADYFRRWHRRKENSGGRLVRKATHHFDLVNGWLDDEPSQVFAIGAQRFHGPTRAGRGERCCTCAYQNSCEFFLNYAADPLRHALDFAAEHEDGYYLDRCEFSEDIDIEDTMNVTVRYKSGAQLAYSLIAHSADEGWRAAVNGTAGRIELLIPESGALAPSNAIRVSNAAGRAGGVRHFQNRPRSRRRRSAPA